MEKKVVFVSGHFNILHPGHLRLFRFAKELGHKLVVGVESDEMAGRAAYINENLRLESVKSISWIDESFVINEPLNSLLERLKPDIVVKGKEHETRLNPELLVLEKYGGKLLFSSGETIFSSVDLIRKEFYESDPRTISLPLEYLKRHDVSLLKLISLLESFSKLKVCVVGDLIVDEYITCQPLGMSQEDPTIVVTPIDSTCFIGGAGIVAAHAAGLGASVQFVSVTGDDTARQFAIDGLAQAGVHSLLLVDDSRPTTLKQRFRSKGKSMLRVSYLHQEAISVTLQKQILEAVEKIIDEVDVLVFSDFNYGCLPQALVNQIVELAKARNIILAADSQSSSQVGDISRFKNMGLLTPTEREARISSRNHEDGLVVLAEQLRQQSGAGNILLKLGEEGLLIHAGSEDPAEWLTDRIGALNSSPKDVAGAGDSLLIASAMTLACKGNIWEAACLGSLAAAIQVGRVGNTPLKTKELMQELTQ
ncbi:MAG: PfkB family carbohydrate kinase [Sediminibacterium sp.]